MTRSASSSADARAAARGKARVLLVGVGGLGCPAAIALASAGVGTIGLSDDDAVELSNLHRQVLFGESDVGTPKVVAAARVIPMWQSVESQGPAAIPQPAGASGGIEIVVHPTRLLPHNARELVARYDVVVEGSDNFATKFLTADACALAGVPVIHAAAVRWHGTVLAVGAQGRPCYRCLFEDLPRDHAPNCAEAGVVGPMVGIIGALQADLALAMIDRRDVAGTLVTYDAKSDELRRRRIAPRTGCDLCGSAPSITRIEASRYMGDASEVACA